MLNQGIYKVWYFYSASPLLVDIFNLIFSLFFSFLPFFSLVICLNCKNFFLNLVQVFLYISQWKQKQRSFVEGNSDRKTLIKWRDESQLSKEVQNLITVHVSWGSWRLFGSRLHNSLPLCFLPSRDQYLGPYLVYDWR